MCGSIRIGLRLARASVEFIMITAIMVDLPQKVPALDYKLRLGFGKGLALVLGCIASKPSKWVKVKLCYT